MDRASEKFARAFGDALKKFLEQKGISEAEGCRLMGVEAATLNTYTHDSPRGDRRRPRAEVLFRACTELGFRFEYNGYRISAASLGKAKNPIPRAAEQLSLDFMRQFNLTEDNGRVSVRLRRHPGRVELSVFLKAAS
jgi:transcriptional regulator with XRE-family HTH domain